MTDGEKSFFRRIPGFRSGTTWKMVLAVLGYGFILLVILSMIFGGDSSSSSSSTPSTSPVAGSTTIQKTKTPTAVPTSTKDVITEGCLSLDLNSVGVRSGEYGNKFITGTIQNTCSRTLSYAQVSYILLDGDGNQVGSAWDNINNLEGGKTWKFDAIVMEDTATNYKFGEMTSF